MAEVNQAEDLNEVLRVRREKLRELQENGKNPFEEVRFPVRDTAAQVKDNFEAYEGKAVVMAGRLMSKRVMGKASFCDLADGDSHIQLYVRRDEVGDDPYLAFKKFDIGDIVGIHGEVFRTHAGEISVKVTQIKLLAKSLRPLPEKFHGLKDMDLKYRQRYVDLIINPDVRNTFVTRSRIVQEIRNYLNKQGYLEVETPILNTIPGGAAKSAVFSGMRGWTRSIIRNLLLLNYMKRMAIITV